MGKFGSGNQGFKPQAMNVVGASNVADLSNAQSQQDAHYPNSTVATTQQHSLEQLQQQVAQMSHLMTTMINNKAMGTPKDHVAGLAYSMLSFSLHDSLHTWIVDTGDYSNHMCYDMNLISNLKKLPHPFQVAFPTGLFISVNYTGSASVSLTSTFTLHHVLLVPTFHCNMLSISKLTEDSTYAVELNSSQFMVKHKGTVLTSGTQKGGLYYLFVDTVIPHINNVGPSINNLPSKLWHLRLVHAPHDVLKHNTSLDISAPCSKDCLVCLAAKQSMLPFPKHSSSHANSPFIFVHMDVWGP